MEEEQARALISALNEEEKQQLHEFLSLMEQADADTRREVLDILRECKA